VVGRGCVIVYGWAGKCCTSLCLYRYVSVGVLMGRLVHVCVCVCVGVPMGRLVHVCVCVCGRG
jgi:hypothetical protein